MKLLRTFLIFLLALAIPLEGLTAVRMIGTVDSTSASMEMHQTMPASHDDCDMNMAEADQVSKSTSSCKMGDTCKICQIFPSTASSARVNPSSVAMMDAIVILSDSFLPSHDPSGLWRPPRSL
jgi:hypothetical protein